MNSINLAIQFQVIIQNRYKLSKKLKKRFSNFDPDAATQESRSAYLAAKVHYYLIWYSLSFIFRNQFSLTETQKLSTISVGICLAKNRERLMLKRPIMSQNFQEIKEEKWDMAKLYRSFGFSIHCYNLLQYFNF